jgi:3-oxoacyl-[acyl-carrier protein] reductase
MPSNWDKEIDPAPIAPLTARQTEEVEDAVEQLLEEVGIETEPRPLLAVGGLRGRGAIVTGASRGIGRAVALELARHGVNIAFNYIESGNTGDREEAETVAAELREMEVNVFCRRCDVRDPDAVRGFVSEAHEELGPLHILVNNAGIGRDSALWRMSDEEWKAVVQTNLSGTFYFIRAVAPLFRAQEYGKIVNISSVHGVRSEFGLANYSASKAGIIGLTQSAAVELGRANVNVNAVAPGYIRTTRLTERVPAEILDRARERSVLGRLGDPQDVAGVVLFLCSEAARHITGAVIPIDGGYLL